jgi:hypothetical protein
MYHEETKMIEWKLTSLISTVITSHIYIQTSTHDSKGVLLILDQNQW